MERKKDQVISDLNKDMADKKKKMRRWVRENAPEEVRT